MSEHATIGALSDIAQRTITAAGSAALITVDETGAPSARAVAAFAPDVDFSRIVIGTHPDSRKTHHVRNTPTVVLSYIDAGNRGYLTVIGRAALDDSLKQRQEYWEERFRAFWPDGLESDDYLLIVVTPERLEIRSFGLGVADQPTRWSPEILQRGGTNEWRRAD